MVDFLLYESSQILCFTFHFVTERFPYRDLIFLHLVYYLTEFFSFLHLHSHGSDISNEFLLRSLDIHQVSFSLSSHSVDDATVFFLKVVRCFASDSRVFLASFKL